MAYTVAALVVIVLVLSFKLWDLYGRVNLLAGKVKTAHNDMRRLEFWVYKWTGTFDKEDED